MGIVAKYKFNQTIYENFIPEFNSEFTNYTITDEIGTDGYTIRTIESDDLPTLMRFGCNWSEVDNSTNREKSLLSVIDMNIQELTTGYCMFYRCYNLLYVNSSLTNTKMTTTANMFQHCNEITSINITLNTINVTDMNAMFQDCSSLTSLDVSNFNTEKVTTMQGMFQGCSSLTSLDVSNFNTEKTTNMSYMFNDCSSLTSLDLSSFNTSKVVYASYMFLRCSMLSSLYIPNFTTQSMESVAGMFSMCSKLTIVDISNLNVEKSDILEMFDGCNLLTTIGVIYLRASEINKIIEICGSSLNMTIWYSDVKLEDLTKKENIAYKEYKMNILESDEEINLRRIGDIYDELNLETGELTQRIGEIVLDGSENWALLRNDSITSVFELNINLNTTTDKNVICDKIDGTFYDVFTDGKEAIKYASMLYINILNSKATTVNELKTYLKSNPVTIQYELKTESIKTVDLKNKPSINWQGDTYIHLKNNTLYPQLDCEIESINYYEIPKLKANTLYTLRYVGEPTQCIFGGLTYKAENNMILTSGSSDNLLYFDEEVRKVILIEGDVRDRNFDYFEGIESLGAVEIITHKTNMPIFAKGGRK